MSMSIKRPNRRRLRPQSWSTSCGSTSSPWTSVRSKLEETKSGLPYLLDQTQRSGQLQVADGASDPLIMFGPETQTHLQSLCPDIVTVHVSPGCRTWTSVRDLTRSESLWWIFLLILDVNDPRTSLNLRLLESTFFLLLLLLRPQQMFAF